MSKPSYNPLKGIDLPSPSPSKDYPRTLARLLSGPSWACSISPSQEAKARNTIWRIVYMDHRSTSVNQVASTLFHCACIAWWPALRTTAQASFEVLQGSGRHEKSKEGHGGLESQGRQRRQGPRTMRQARVNHNHSLLGICS